MNPAKWGIISMVTKRLKFINRLQKRKLFLFPFSLFVAVVVFFLWNIIVVQAADHTLRPNGNGTVTGWTSTNSNAIFSEIDDDPDSSTDVDYVEGPDSTNTTMFVDLSTLPSGFASADTVEIKAKHGEVGAGNDTIALEYQIYQSNESTAITAETAFGNLADDQNSSVTYETDTSGVSITGTNTQAVWENARLRIRQINTKNQGPDAGWGRITAVEVKITYTPANQVTAGSTGTQTVTMVLGTTNQHSGGAFTMVSDTSTVTVSSMTVSDTGTINATSHLSNLDIYYETAGTCTYDGNETLFGTDTTLSSEQAVVSGSMSVGTSQVCVYAVVDVSGSASAGQTIELQITDPSSNVTVSSGTVTPASAVAIAGTTTLDAPNIPTKVVFTNSQRTFTANECNGSANVFTMQLQNDSNEATNPSQSTIVRVSSDSTGETIYTDDTCETEATNGDFTFSTSENTKSVYIIDTEASSPTWILSGVRQSGDSLTTGTQDYIVEAQAPDTKNTKVRGGIRFQGGVQVR